MPKYSDISSGSDSDSDSDSDYCDTTSSRAGSTSPIRRRVGIHMPAPPPTPEPPSPSQWPSRPASPTLSDISDIRCSTALSTHKDIDDNNNEEPDEAPPGDNIVTQVRWIIFYAKRKVNKTLLFLYNFRWRNRPIGLEKITM